MTSATEWVSLSKAFMQPHEYVFEQQQQASYRESETHSRATSPDSHTKLHGDSLFIAARAGRSSLTKCSRYFECGLPNCSTHTGGSVGFPRSSNCSISGSTPGAGSGCVDLPSRDRPASTMAGEEQGTEGSSSRRCRGKGTVGLEHTGFGRIARCRKTFGRRHSVDYRSG